MAYILPFLSISLSDLARVGGKNASLGEMTQGLARHGIQVPEGFAVTAVMFKDFLEVNHLKDPLTRLLATLQPGLENLPEIGSQCRTWVSEGEFSPEMIETIASAYADLGSPSVAVRSSATAEDLPNASFAGQHDSFLNISGLENLLNAVRKCYVSLFNDRAIKYRNDHGFEHMEVFLSVGIQRMVRSDIGSAGVAFTLDPETGINKMVYITSAWGLGENVVQGSVSPDEFYVFKESLKKNKKAILRRRLGAKETKIVYSTVEGEALKTEVCSASERSHYSLSDKDVELLGRWCVTIEEHYGQPMDIEWARDGQTGEIFIVQARPETVHSLHESLTISEYTLHPVEEPLCRGKAVGSGVSTGRACIVSSLADGHKVQQGDIIVAEITNPDWNALLKKAICIVTNKGGRTSHASIVARELGIHAVVGTGNATQKIRDGQEITVCCVQGDEGQVYRGKVEYDKTITEIKELPETKTRPMFILADPDRALRLSLHPNQGVGLLRMEFIINNLIRIHPMALIHAHSLPESHERSAIMAITSQFNDKRAYFTQTLSEGIAMVAAAFYPKDIVVRMSDFKSNEYAQLLGGKWYEPEEENPMLGFRGASRYYHPAYQEGFGLECEAIRIVRDDMGLTNVKVMIPFCRTVEEGKRVLQVMKSYGLEKGVNGLSVYVMAEIPSNVILAESFADIFDGFSIGSNDLTQLVLGIDRDSAMIADLFDESNPAVLEMLKTVIQAAKKKGKTIGLCGQAPSDRPEFARFLVEQGIDSVSFNPDAMLRGIRMIAAAEAEYGVL
jgi:pyruvate, water dikinase